MVIAVCLALFATTRFVSDQTNIGAMQIGLALAFIGACGLLMFQLASSVYQKRKNSQIQALTSLIESDTREKFLIDKTYNVLSRNEKARGSGMLAPRLNQDLRLRLLEGEDLLARLMQRAKRHQTVQETCITRTGKIDVEVTQVTKHIYLVSVLAKQHPSNGFALPMITVAANGTILFMNKPAREFLGGRSTKLKDILDEEAAMSDVNIVRTEQGSRRCFLMENDLSGGRREIFILPAAGNKNTSPDMSYEDMPVAVLKIDHMGKILASNRTARMMIGPEAAERQHLSEVMEGLGRPLSDWLAEAAEGRANNLNEFLRIKRDDKERFVQVTLGRAFDDDPPTLYAIFHDATELKTLEAQFVQSQKMQAIGQLAGGIAHDFNNLLTAMNGHCDLMLLQRSPDEPIYADLIQIQQNANRAAALVRQLLAFSRKQTLQPDTIDLREVMSDVSHLLSRLVADDVNLRVEHEDNLSLVYLDPQQFEQVIMNLVVNARDAMPDGGDVVVRTDNKTLKRPLVRERATVPPGHYVRVQVIDQGGGIDRDKKEKVFEPFYTTKNTGEGTGLGLSTAYGIVKQSGGFIFLDSEVGKGTTFTLLFPTAEKKPPVFVRNPKQPKVEADASGTILLVEDEAPVRAFASRALRLKGFSVLEASCGEEALEILEDEDLQIDLFLTDVSMPGIDGPTWVKKARETRDSPVIFISGYAEEKFADNSSHVADAVFLPKPFSLERLISTVRQQLVTESLKAVV